MIKTVTENQLKSDIDLEISNTEKDIKAKKAFLERLETELKQFLKDNEGLHIPVSQIVDDSDLNPVQLLAEIERLKGLETARLEKLASVRKAEQLFNSRINSERAELELTEQHLEVLKAEKEWQEKYLPLANKFESCFIQKVTDEFDKKIQGVRNTLNDWQDKARKLEISLKYPTAKEQTHEIRANSSVHYDEAVTYLDKLRNQDIPPIEKQLQDLENQKSITLENIRDSSEYRDFIKARVDIDRAVNALKIAETEYLTRLQAFASIKNSCKACINKSEINHGAILSIEIDDYISITELSVSI